MRAIESEPMWAKFGIAALTLAVAACGKEGAQQSKAPAVGESPKVIEGGWTDAAETRAKELVGAGKRKYSLPELRIYDARHQLIFRNYGTDAGKVAAIVSAAISADRPTAGPSFSETFGELETSDHRPAIDSLSEHKPVTIVDYWAEWCIPCKAQEKELLAWAATQSADEVQIVHAETDITKIARANGAKIKKFMKGSDGKLIKVETIG